MIRIILLHTLLLVVGIIIIHAAVGFQTVGGSLFLDLGAELPRLAGEFLTVVRCARGKQKRRSPEAMGPRRQRFSLIMRCNI